MPDLSPEGAQLGVLLAGTQDSNLESRVLETDSTGLHNTRAHAAEVCVTARGWRHLESPVLDPVSYTLAVLESAGLLGSSSLDETF